MRNPYTWLITDTHWNADFKGFRPLDYSQRIVKNCRKVIAPQDALIHMGDVINDRPGELEGYLGSINCRTKILLRGNHDMNKDTWYLNKGFNLVCNQLVIEDMLLTHIPQKPNGTRINIHGHFHDNPLEKCFSFEPHLKEIYDPNYHRLLAMEKTNYCPVRLDEFGR